MPEGAGEGGPCTPWGEIMLGRALLLLGSAFQAAIFLVAIQSFLNTDRFQDQASSRQYRFTL